MTAMLALASGCRVVGSGTLGYVPAGASRGPWSYVQPVQPAANSGSPVTVQVFRPVPGDTWPPAGTLGLWLHADNMPALAVNVGDLKRQLYTDEQIYERTRTLYLIRLHGALEEANPEFAQYRSCDELLSHPERQGTVWVGPLLGEIAFNPDGPLDALITIDDTPENRQTSWVLATSSWGLQGQRTAIRCGTITLTP